MSSDKAWLNAFQTNCMQFLDELIEMFPAEVELVLVKHYVSDSSRVQTIMNGFITGVLPHKAKIQERNSEFFFVELSTSGFSKEHANRIRILWRSSVLDDDDRKVIWAWMDTFVHCAERYLEATKN